MLFALVFVINDFIFALEALDGLHEKYGESLGHFGRRSLDHDSFARPGCLSLLDDSLSSERRGVKSRFGGKRNLFLGT